ncbi:winged helix DNA-binding domain-containing protein [Myxococcus stipitatus]|uniref:winged helix DNA-binding domain-containing protein n=1 Tax=Myxococcus stipitatus TaxID=83455 RepID=UPI0031451469
MASTSLPSPTVLQPDEARRFLIGQHGLARPLHPPGARGARALLKALRCIQLDPLDVIGTNADLVALARVDGLTRGDVYRHLLPGHAFEHFAKERCLLPASAFPYYRDHAIQAPWWRQEERLKRIPESVLHAVLDEVTRKGPSSSRDLTDHGTVKPLDWSGWKSTARATAMALDVLWTRCQVVVCGRGPGGKLYDIPRRALPRMAEAAVKTPFQRWALLERVEAAGLLSRASGPHWSSLSDVRTAALPDALVAEGALEEVSVPGSPRRYLAPMGFREREFPEPDTRMRILGPLDPVLWDRGLVRVAFGFDYVWEVYKPAAQRQWGWYVCPLLHRGKLVGRLEARVREGELQVDNLWREKGAKLDDAALDEALARHAVACGAQLARRPRARVAS